MQKDVGRLAIVVFSLGGPDGPQAVRPFLFNLFNDKAIIGATQPMRWLLAQLITMMAVFAASLAKCRNKDELRQAVRKELLTHFEDDRWHLRQVRLSALGSGYARPDLAASLALAQRHRATHGMLVPVQGWFRGPLLPQARERLLEGLAPWGLFERGYLERLLDGRLAGIHTRRGVKIWLLITLEAWLRGVFRA